MAHRTDTWNTRVLGARRYQARCETCSWRGEARPKREQARHDGDVHEALADPPRVGAKDAA